MARRVVAMTLPGMDDVQVLEGQRYTAAEAITCGWTFIVRLAWRLTRGGRR